MAEEARGLWGNARGISTPPDNALRDEALTLDRAFEVMVIGELAAFRGESGVSQIREGLRSATSQFPLGTWQELGSRPRPRLSSAMTRLCWAVCCCGRSHRIVTRGDAAG